ncbi:hypothetical protein D9758_014021 [Tetrapyrgos nigripes]|uniref:MFS general substrate transporter n=1 Tax=Tetrapyrgos nigripes TaxID=182062 RepID=A0A8H5CZB6_9AGAR|nr:hypothetical protein D9758_014021 [Tetrapyrgos nigripes]
MAGSPKLSIEKDQVSQVEKAQDDYDFGGESQLPPPPILTEEEERRLYRKIDIRLMPILCLMYLFSFLDRGNIGNARLQGLEKQLNLVGNQFNIALPYCIFECPANLVLKKFRPSLWLPGITVVWGIIMTLMGLVKTYPQLVGVRVCLGVAEAGLFPGVSYYLTLWYPRSHLQYRIGLFFGAATLAGAFSGLLAYGISFMSGTRGLLGWSWIFILEGIATVGVGILAFFYLVDFPVTANFLTPEERAYIVWKKSKCRYSRDLKSKARCLKPIRFAMTLEYDNSSVGEEEHFEVKHIIQAVTDWQVWLHILIYMSLIAPLYGITLFLPTIISNFGTFSTAESQLLTVPPYVFASKFFDFEIRRTTRYELISSSFFLLPPTPFPFSPSLHQSIVLIMLLATVLLFFAYFSDKIHMRSPFVYTALLMCLVGFSINISDVAPGVKYFGTFLVVGGSYAGFPGVVAWLGNNLCGQYKRAVGMALHIGIGNFSGAIASNVYRTKDKPRFVVGHGIELMFVGIGLICVPIAVLSYRRINAKREVLLQEMKEQGKVYSPAELRAMGDRAPDFRYIL